MDIETYSKLTERTESQDFMDIGERIVPEGVDLYKKENNSILRLLHGAVGAAGECGELLDQVKGHVFYGKKLDWINIMEEIGDTVWYLDLAMKVVQRETGLTWSDCFQKNIDKLRTRYPDKFSGQAAVDRNLPAEREILENSNDNIRKNTENEGGKND